jgi:hypothetical protein
MKIEPIKVQSPPVQPAKATEAPAPTAKAPAIQPAITVKDTVELSLPAQARQLKLEGQSINEIAYKLSLPVQTVSQYLGLTEQKQE